MSVVFEPSAIPDVVVVVPKRFTDQRGHFVETWNARSFASLTSLPFVQDNASLSHPAGTVRGLHFQTEPSAQGKLVRVIRGRILDVTVDIRRSSPSFGQHVAVELSAENGKQLWVPPGFAHGFITREQDTEVAYKVTGFYDAACDAGIFWNDPSLGIDWGIGEDDVTLSDKDKIQPLLANAPRLFP